MIEMVAVVLLAAAGGSLSLRVTTPQRDVVPGEPIKLVMRWEARRTLPVFLVDGQQNVETLEITVRRSDGQSVGSYYEYGIGSQVSGSPSRYELARGRSVVRNVYLVRGGYGEREDHRPGFIFNEVGDYSIVVRYREGATVIAESNAVGFEVREPVGDEAKVRAIVTRSPGLLRSTGPEAQALLERYPGSRYVQHLKVVQAERWRHDLVNLVDPHSREVVAGLYGRDLARWTAEQTRGLAAKLLADDSWGPFDEERLAWSASFTEWSGDPSGAAQLRAEITARFPESRAAHAQEEGPVP